MNRYIKMKGVVWPDEFKTFHLLFADKHPEFMGSTRIKNDAMQYGYAGCYWDYKMKLPVRLFGYYDGLFYGEPIRPKPEKRDKVFLDLIGNELQLIKRGRWNAINKRNK